jgi:hypothetical protein
MSNSKLPQFVASAARALKGAQFSFIATATIWAYQTQISGTEVSGAAMGRAICAEFPELAQKTVENYCATAALLARVHAPTLAPMWAASDKPADVVKAFAAWLSGELKTKAYTQSEPDLRAHANGKPSMAAKLQAEKDAQATAAAAAAAAASAPVLGDAANKAPEETPQAEVTPKAEPVPAAEREAAAPAPKDAPKAAPKADKPEPVIVLTVRRDAEGRFIVSPDAALTSADLPVILAMLEALALPAPAPVMDAPRIPADVRTAEPALV